MDTAPAAMLNTPAVTLSPDQFAALLKWTQETATRSELPAAEFLTAEEVIAWLRLDAGGCDGKERLRSMERYQQMPVCRRGKVIRYHAPTLRSWLLGEKIRNPNRKQANKLLHQSSSAR